MTRLQDSVEFGERNIASHVELLNVPGALGNFAGKLAAKEINITSGYQTTVKGSRKASVVLVVCDLDTAGRVR
jgi:hypothetical protein